MDREEFFVRRRSRDSGRPAAFRRCGGVWGLAVLFAALGVAWLCVRPAWAGNCPNGADRLSGGGEWSNGAYGGSWDVTLACANGAVTGTVDVGDSNSCSGFPVSGKLTETKVMFKNTDNACGDWDVSIPLPPLPGRAIDFAPYSGDYSGVEIVHFRWR